MSSDYELTNIDDDHGEQRESIFFFFLGINAQKAKPLLYVRNRKEGRMLEKECRHCQQEQAAPWQLNTDERLTRSKSSLKLCLYLAKYVDILMLFSFSFPFFLVIFRDF